MGRGISSPWKLFPLAANIAEQPSRSSLAAALCLQPCSAREVFWAGNVTPGCSGGKYYLWVQSRLHRSSSRSLPPLYKASLLLP